jgi:hypothetical protein
VCDKQAKKPSGLALNAIDLKSGLHQGILRLTVEVTAPVIRIPWNVKQVY